MSHPASVVVLVVDRLGAGHLGPYGNSWPPTPQMNRLASESLLCETCLIDRPDVAAAYRAWWTGRHALEPAAEPEVSLPLLARERGLQSLLITDDVEMARLPLAQHFDEHLLVETPAASKCADSIEETGLFQLVALAIEALEERPQPLLAWIHARGMSAEWDAPYELRAALADLDDPAPPRLVVPPERRLEAGFDPDEVLGLGQAYSAQVQLVDECLGQVLAALARHPQAGNLLFALTAPRGYPLGEHGRLGDCDRALYSELIHVPLLIRFPQSEHQLNRVQSFVQPGDLWATVAACWGMPSTSAVARSVIDVPWRRDIAFIGGQDQRAIRTPAWYLREAVGTKNPQRELFAKPDDRWEANEVASRCDVVVDQLAAELDLVERALAAGKCAQLPPLADELTSVWR